MALTLHLWGHSDVGRVRQRNEDALALAHEPPLLIVADGLGGHPAGDVASLLAVEAARSVLVGAAAPAAPREVGKPVAHPTQGAVHEPSADALREMMLEAVAAAERAVAEASQRRIDLRGMGTTLTALTLHPGDGRWAIGHVGDSRAYRWADGRLSQLTRDHTSVQEEVERGALSPGEAREHPWRHILTQALGVAATRPQLVEGRASAGDVYLLCTDGLTTMLPDGAIERILEDAVPDGLEATGRALVAAANDRGGKDNITVALLAVWEEE